MAKKKSESNYTAPDERVEAGLVEKDYKQQPWEEVDGEDLFDHELLAEEAERAARTGAPHAGPLTSNPSEMQNPYVSEEEQGMEMRPQVVGPPAYGSPDPLTSAGRLMPLEQHPLRADALPEGHPAAISADYGKDVTDLTLKGTQTLASSPIHAESDLDRHTVGDFSVETNAEVEATDAARDLADAEGVDLTSVEGTGAEGRVTVDDVKAALADRDEA